MTRNELSAVGLVCLTSVTGLAVVLNAYPALLSGAEWRNLLPAPLVREEPARPIAGPIKANIEAPPLTSCLPTEVADNARIVVLGAYEGGLTTPFSIGTENHEVGSVALAADETGPPLLIVVSAYDPVIWDFRRVPVGRIRAVIAYGYADQAVAGVPAQIPVRFISYSTPNPACGSFVYAYKGGPELDQLAASVQRISGRAPQSFQGAYGPTGFHLDGKAAPAARLEGLDGAGIRAARETRKDAVSPGAEGLTELVNIGALRPANPDDIDNLSKVLTRASLTGYLAPQRARVPTGLSTYVVLRQTMLPKGMYGAHSATFLVPPGVPMPSDPGSHNTYFMMADGGCLGPMCGHGGG